MQHHLSFFTEYYQFYIQDSQTISATDDASFWNNEAGENRLAVLNGLLGVTVAKYAEIKVNVSFLDEKPTQDTDAEHIVEASIKINSGILEVRNCTNFDLELAQNLEKGTYRVRISSFKISTVVNDEGEDFYNVEIWKSRAAKTKVLKKYKI
jgi:hypothetical protein